MHPSNTPLSHENGYREVWDIMFLNVKNDRPKVFMLEVKAA